MKRIIITLFILLCLLPVTSFGADTDKPIQIAWNFQYGFTFGNPSTSGTPEATYFLLREDGSVMLREDGSKFLREDAP